jgi:hypothetical protein
MLRRRLTAVLGLLTVVPVALLTTAAAVPAASSAPAAGLRVTSATVTTVPPAQTKPMVEDCFAGRSAAGCGFGVVEITLTGFDAYGGIPDCAAAYSDACDLPVAEVADAVGTRVDVAVRCAGDLLPRVRTLAVGTDPGAQQWAAQVGPCRCRRGSTARVKAEFTLPPPSAFGACRPGQAVTFLGAVARRVTVGWTSPSATVPDGHATLTGLYRFAAAR